MDEPFTIGRNGAAVAQLVADDVVGADHRQNFP
jgi:hypothetical protein